MKKLLITALVWCTSLWLTFAQDSNQDVVSWLYSNWLTKYSSASSFRPYDSITRGEAAKFMVEYAQMQQMPKVKSAQECQFSDIANYDSTLRPYIVQACEYGIFKWSNGRYFPNNNITKGEAIAVVMRTRYGMQIEQGIDPWYSMYYNKAETLKLTLWNINWFNNIINRVDIGRWLKETTINSIPKAGKTSISTSYGSINLPFDEISIFTYNDNYLGINNIVHPMSNHQYTLEIMPKRSTNEIRTEIWSNVTVSQIQSVSFAWLQGLQWYEWWMWYQWKVELVWNNANYVFTIFSNETSSFQEWNEIISMKEFYEKMQWFEEN